MIRKKTIPGAHWAGLMPAVLISLLVHVGASVAAESTPAAQYQIQTPAQSLADSLRSIAHETNTSVLFDPAIVRGRVSHAVSGSLTAFAAFTAALEGTGLDAQQTGDSSFVVRASATSPTTPASGIRASTPAAAAGLVEGDRLSTETVTRVEVTGSRLKRINAEGPAPVNVYTAKDIEQSGQPNLERFLAGLNEVSASSGEGGFGSTLGQATVQLRGLPVGSTLVLINGRRVEAVGSSASNLFNLNLIPASAIERVEIVPVGSSAIYGGDALAGVVNVITKKSIDGVSLAANGGAGRGFGDGGLSLATGGSNADGSFLLMGSYSRATPLTMSERGFFRDADYRRFGGDDGRWPYCTPGNVNSVSGANLPGLDSSFAAIPLLPAGQTPQLSDYTGTSGTARSCNYFTNGDGYPLAYDDQTLALHATGEYRIAGSWSAFGELTLAKDRLKSKGIGLGLFYANVPASNLYNPFGVDVTVTSLLGPENGSQGFARDTRFTRAVAGARGDLGGDWDAEVAASTTRDSGGSQSGGANNDATALAAALASTSPASAFNPFTSGRAASDEVLRGIWSSTDRHSRGRKEEVSALARGSLLRLPAGALEVVVGAESAIDHYDVSIPAQEFEVHDSRRDSAAYGELRVPLLKAGEAAKEWNAVALTLAARRDHYSDFGAANTYQAGLELRPLRSLLIRASSATSFKPPTMQESHLDDDEEAAVEFGLVDPARGGEAITSGNVIQRSNRRLRAERGRAGSFGAVWEPEGSLGARFSATHWQVHVNGLIAMLQPQTVLDDEALLPGFVTRDPPVDGQPGHVTSVLLTYANLGSVQAAGTDMEAAYAWRGPLGKWNATASATRTNEYQVVLSPGAGKQDRLGRRFEDFWAPRWKTRASLELDGGGWTLGLTGRYLGKYKDAGNSERRLGSYWVEDMAASLDVKKNFPGLVSALKAASLSLNVANLGDRQPQFVETLPYYDVTQADWRGRYISTKLSVDW